MATGQLSKSELFAFERTLLDKEIDYVHSSISHYDDISFIVKGWAVTIWSAIVAFGATQKVPFVVLANIPAVLGFWVLDALFKQYQRRNMYRMGVIEMFIDSAGLFKDRGLRFSFKRMDFDGFPVHDPIGSRTRKLSQELDIKYKKKTSYLSAFMVANISAFYSLLILSAILIVVLLSTGIVPT
jgi:hypothetical protein